MSINNNSSKYTRQRQSGWKLTINTGQYLALYENDEETDLRRIANLIADELEKANQNPLLTLIDANEELTGIIEDFRLVTDDVEELDDCLAEMYNWGDYYRIWFSPVLEAKKQDHDNDYDWRADGNVYPFDTVVVWPGAGGGGTGSEPPGTTALDALLNHPDLTYARTRLSAWQKYNPNTIPLDAVDALAIALKAIDLLIAERYAARDTTSVYAPPVGVCFTVYHTNRDDSPDSHVFEQHKANPNGTPQCGTRYPLQPYTPFIAADLCPRCYPAPAQPSAPAVAATPDYRAARGVLADVADEPAEVSIRRQRDAAAQPEAARAGAKLSTAQRAALEMLAKPTVRVSRGWQRPSGSRWVVKDGNVRGHIAGGVARALIDKGLAKASERTLDWLYLTITPAGLAALDGAK